MSGFDPANPTHDLTRVWVGALCVGALIVTTFWIVRPFFAAAVWAATVVLVLWPLLQRLQRRLGGSRALAIATLTAVVLLLLAVPLVLAFAALVSHGDDLVRQVRQLGGLQSATPPEWVHRVPWIGPRLAQAWLQAGASVPEVLGSRIVPYAGSLARWLLLRIGNLGYLTVQFILTLVLAAFMFAHGDALASTALRIGRKLGGSTGERLVVLAGNAVRGVALGVGLTAAIQSVIAGAGLAIVGVPYSGPLTALCFLLCIAQVGMLIVLVPAVAWVYWHGGPVSGTVLLAWSLAAALLDQVLRPYLVGRSARLPALLIFVGVVGGIVAFGPLGIVVGPVALAVGYTSLVTWLGERSSVAQEGAS